MDSGVVYPVAIGFQSRIQIREFTADLPDGRQGMENAKSGRTTLRKLSGRCFSAASRIISNLIAIGPVPIFVPAFPVYMIVIIFISLAVVYFFIQHFENRRKARNEEQHERKREAFQNLLNLLEEKRYPEEKE